MTLPSPPNITQGQIAIDPVNGVLYYRNSSGNIISSTLNLHQTDEDSVDTNNNIAIDNSMSISGSLDVQNLTINGSLSASGSTGFSGQFLRSTGNGVVWETIQSGGGGGGSGSVTYINLTVPTGLSVSGGPIVTSGTFAITFSAGYSIPTTASQTNWDTAYNDRLKWDGGSSGLVASTGRASLGLGSTDTPTFGGLIISGNLTVNGTTTTVNSTTTTLDDPIITLGGDTAPSSDDNKDRGVEFRWHDGTSAKVGFFGYDDSTGKFTFIPDATNTSEVFSGTLGTIDVGAVHINGSQIAAANLSNGTTGTGSIALATSPTLVTPNIGVATATTVNRVAITQPASSATITIANGKTLTVNNSITFAGTDGTTITMPATSGTVALNNQTMFIGTTSVAINRTSGSLTLTGITLSAGTLSAGTLTGTLTAAGTTGTAGQVLQSTGTGVQWATISTGSQSATPDLTNIKSISFPDYIFFNTSNATPSQATGKLQWDPDYGMLQYGLFGGNVNIDIGQEQVVSCFNLEATTINKGEVVYIFGAQGGLVSVKRASNTSDLTSAKTLGVAAENIISSGIGYVATQGLVQKLDLTAFNPGDILWLGSTPGTVTTLKPQAPNHIVFVGVVLRNNAGNGTMFIKPQNGYELDEIHDVLIATPNVNDFLKWNGTVWVNDQINLGSETVGDYVQNLVAGTGITITNNSGEGATPTIAVTANTYQPLDAELTALAGLTSAADALPYFTGSRNCRYDNSNISCKKHIRRYKCWCNKNYLGSWNS